MLLRRRKKNVVRLPGVELELTEAGVHIRPRKEQLERFSGIYSWPLVPKGLAMYRLLIENEVADMTFDELVELAELYGITPEELDAIWGKDCKRGLVALQAFFQLAIASMNSLVFLSGSQIPVSG